MADVDFQANSTAASTQAIKTSSKPATKHKQIAVAPAEVDFEAERAHQKKAEYERQLAEATRPGSSPNLLQCLKTFEELDASIDSSCQDITALVKAALKTLPSDHDLLVMSTTMSTEGKQTDAVCRLGQSIHTARRLLGMIEARSSDVIFLVENCADTCGAWTLPERIRLKSSAA